MQYFMLQDSSFTVLLKEESNTQTKVIYTRCDNPYIKKVVESVCENIENDNDYWIKMKEASILIEADNDEEILEMVKSDDN